MKGLKLNIIVLVCAVFFISAYLFSFNYNTFDSCISYDGQTEISISSVSSTQAHDILEDFSHQKYTYSETNSSINVIVNALSFIAADIIPFHLKECVLDNFSYHKPIILVSFSISVLRSIRI